MRVLLTNDDGVRAPGLAHLAQALHGRGWDITIAAPLAEASGAGAGVGAVHTMGEGIPVEQLELAGLEGIPTFAVAGLPALIVISGCLGAFGPPPTSSSLASTRVATSDVRPSTLERSELRSPLFTSTSAAWP